MRGLHKNYGEVHAVRGVDLDIEEGEVFALLGPNGAGKTTTVEILEGYRDRTGGSVLVLGEDPQRAGRAWRARIGIVLQESAPIEELTVREAITHFARFYPDPLDPDEVIRLVGLEEKAATRGSRLSGGQKRRLDVALGIVGNPDLIFLDEPTTGFDPAARRQAWDVVLGLTGLGKTILLTTHYLDEAEHLADRVGVIAAGRLVEVATPRDLGGRASALARVSFRLTGALAGSKPPTVDGATPSIEDDVVTYETATPTQALRALAAWADGAGERELPELAVTRPSLEDAYLSMLDQLREATA